MPISNTLAARLTPMTPYKGRGAIVSVTGREGEGKTAFALSAVPEKGARQGAGVYIKMDRKVQGAYINSLLESREVYIPKFNTAVLVAANTKKFDIEQGIKAWNEVASITHDAIVDPGIRTVIWDTATQAWALLRLKHFGKLTQVMPHRYAEVNSEFETLLYLAEDFGKIFICVNKMSKEYKQNAKGDAESWTGKYERAGYSHLGNVCNIAVHLGKTDDGKFAATVEKNKLNPESDGEELVGDVCCWDALSAITWQD